MYTQTINGETENTHKEKKEISMLRKERKIFFYDYLAGGGIE